MGKLTRIAPVAGRILISQIFIISGFSKIAHWKGTAAYMASKGMPMAGLFLVGAILIEVLCGFSILLGLKSRIGAAVLVVYLVVVSLIFHNFWAYEGMEKQVQMIMFMKNLAIMGGLLFVYAFDAARQGRDNQ